MVKDRYITLAHGNGGRFMRELIEEVFARHLGNPALDVDLDAVGLDLPQDRVPVVSTDGFVVQPLEFPGGTIGSIAVNGSVNDLAVSGAVPAYLTLGAIIEEGLELEVLDRIVASMAEAARQACVAVVAGDTKVVPRGQGGGLYLTVTGVGHRARDCRLSMSAIRDGDAVLVSGPVGDHAVAILLAREAFDLSGSVVSDCAPVIDLTLPLATHPSVRFMRDPTRGGLATVAHEIARATGFDLVLEQTAVPVADPVRSVCEILGYDPYYLACEGRVVAVVAAEAADEVLAIWRNLPAGHGACRIGSVSTGTGRTGRVILRTEIGGSRVLEELEDDPLPRIC
ncbi:hydrogenase expression/formation protein HypE [Mesobacterium sp. TK19101]|uniref:Hydrogenase expression/formation protein HypE n=1 Tax=Mesobacterium hydrothermale TaxID=3111907 RepID=A0ABU6HLL1_9RHOB|nr:hydrogenase expression/formation protein HypE [Mesobacterium sp. TK19101]MEC3862779.1 hydrogenase expression/formation protein HypE [Mesobacterium sp. TK19101]